MAVAAFIDRNQSLRWSEGAPSFILIAAVCLLYWPGQRASASSIGGSLRLTETNSSDPFRWYLTGTNNVSYRPASTGQSAFGSTVSQSWYITCTNSSSYQFQNGDHYLKVTISVDDSKNAAITVRPLSMLTDNKYLIDRFAFNWEGGGDIHDRLLTAIGNSSAPLSRWSVRRSNGGPTGDMAGLGRYDYVIDADGDKNRAQSLSFVMDLSSLGLTKDEILKNFQVLSSGSDGSGFFAAHVSTGGEGEWCNDCLTDSFDAAGADPAPSFAPSVGKSNPPSTSIDSVSPTGGQTTFASGLNGLGGGGGGGGGFSPLWSNIFGTGGGGGGLPGGGGSSSATSIAPNIMFPEINPSGPNPPGPNPPGPNPPAAVPEPNSLLSMVLIVGLLLPFFLWRRTRVRIVNRTACI